MMDPIRAMYQKRLDKLEIKKMVSDVTIKKHAKNLEKIDVIFKGSGKDISEMNWLVTSSTDDLIKTVGDIKGRKSDKIGLSAQLSYLSSILVGIRVLQFDDFHTNETFKGIDKYIHDKNGFAKDLMEKKADKTDVIIPDIAKIRMLVYNAIKDEKVELDLKIQLLIYIIHPFRLEVADLIYIKLIDYKKILKKGSLVRNYLVVGSKQMFFSFSDYKTFDVYGLRKIIIKNRAFKKLLKKKIETLNNNDRLFGDLKRNTLSHIITAFFESKGLSGINVTNLTKMIVSETYHKLDPSIIKEQDRLAKERGHSLSTQIMVYVLENQ